MEILDYLTQLSETTNKFADKFQEEVGGGAVSNAIRESILTNPQSTAILVGRISGEHSMKKAREFCDENGGFRIIEYTSSIDNRKYISWAEEIPENYKVVYP